MDEPFQIMVRLCRAGCIGLVLFGPPCETWSSARHIQVDHGGPRPLRSRERPWGLRRLSVAELKQFLTGTSLMVRGLILEPATALSGGACVMEHPMLPKSEEHASVWSTSYNLNFLMQLPAAKACAFEQWRYGSSAIKPTLLRALGLPSFSSKFLAHGEVPVQSRPTTLLGGFDWMKKHYRTAAAKECPSHMCFALLDAALDSLAHRLQQEGPSVASFDSLSQGDRAWLAAVKHQSSKVFATTFKADYQPTSL